MIGIYIKHKFQIFAQSIPNQVSLFSKLESPYFFFLSFLPSYSLNSFCILGKCGEQSGKRTVTEYGNHIICLHDFLLAVAASIERVWIVQVQCTSFKRLGKSLPPIRLFPLSTLAACLFFVCRFSFCLSCCLVRLVYLVCLV